MVTFEEFKKISLKVGRIKEVIDHPNADKLFIVKVDIGGGELEVVAGLKKAYKPEELTGKLVAVVDNLEPATIRGVESKGMILAAHDGENFAVLSIDKEVAPGSTIK
tara:strand:- start:189 stop:509 length:321 start_codon:yes stop_codon:yes gene_type:complete